MTIFFQVLFLNARYGERKIVEECPWCDEKQSEDVLFIPINPAFLRLTAPADPDFLADLMWMRSSYYFGAHALTDREYPYFTHLLDMVTDLSPKWDLPYIFGAVLLPVEADSLEDGLFIINKGLIHHPNNWELWFFKGFYYFKLMDDKIEGAKMLQRAGQLPGSPIYLSNLAATLATKAGEKELAVRFLQEALGNVRDSRQRDILLKKMKEVMKDDDSGAVME